MSHESNLTISAFFPFLNDWGTIGSLVVALDSTLKEVACQYEIIVVDDGSNQESKKLLSALNQVFPAMRVVSHEHNRGYGGALQSGISNAKLEWIFYTDGDAQYDPRDLHKLVEKLKASPNADVINGYKIKRNDPWYRKLLGRIYHWVVKILFNVPIRDTDCDFRLMRRSIFDTVELTSNSGLICAEMVKKISDFGFKFEEEGVRHFWRTSGKSQFFNFKRVSKVLIGLLGLWYQLVIRKVHLKNAGNRN